MKDRISLAALALSNALMDIPEGGVHREQVEQLDTAHHIVITATGRHITVAAKRDMARAAHRLIVEAVRERWDTEYSGESSRWLGYAIEAMGNLRHYIHDRRTTG